MVFNTTFNNVTYIMVVSCIGGGNHRLAVSLWQLLSNNLISSTPRLNEIRPLVAIGTDCSSTNIRPWQLLKCTWMVLNTLKMYSETCHGFNDKVFLQSYKSINGFPIICECDCYLTQRLYNNNELDPKTFKICIFCSPLSNQH